jgi:peptidoglycan/xylan/chitin deacetylase (PgdA/CDA1 family)
MTDAKGTFIISLDFELHWGGFEKWPLEEYKQYFLNTRAVIPEMLDLFRQHEVHVTWAGVGMLFHTTRESLTLDFPKQKPSYAAAELSAYNFIEDYGIGETEEEDPFHFAGSLVNQIVMTPFQELGTHTFAHYYCNEEGQTLEQFRADLRSAQRSAEHYGKKLRSLVFPRNQFNPAYLKVCCEEGIVAVRDNPRDWFWDIQSTQQESYWKRLNRGVDAYWPLGRKNTYPLDSVLYIPGLPVCIPASRLLRPYRPSELFLNSMKISRIASEMERAARKGEVYHLWWHPHNFGRYPKESMAGLQQILTAYDRCREQYGMLSMTMGEVAEEIMVNC